MGWLGWLLVASGLVVGGLVLFLAIRSGAIWEGVYRALKRGAIALFWAMVPGLVKIFKPAENLDEIKAADDRGSERDRLNKGSGRPFGRGKE